jgi:LysM repeat protein
MNNRRLSYGLLLALSTALMAGCGDPVTPEVPPQPSAAVPEVPSAIPSAVVDTPAPPASGTAEPPVAPTPVKTAKEKFVGKFAQDFQGDVKDAFEATAKTKFAKEKDSKKHDAAMKAIVDGLAQTTIENTGDTHTFSVKGKPVHSIKFEIAKDEASALTIKLGKDATTKKDLKNAEITITFTDDNTFSVKDPFAKDPKKAQTLFFKRL